MGRANLAPPRVGLGAEASARLDTARSGGWRDLTTMKTSYQQSDAATRLKVIENESAAPTSDSSQKRSGDAATS